MAGKTISKTLQNDIGIERFTEIFLNNSNSKTAKILDIGVSTVSFYAKQLNISKSVSENCKKGGRPKKGNKPATNKTKCEKFHEEICESLYHNIKVGEIANKCKIDKGQLYTYIQVKGGKIKLIEEYKEKKTTEVKDFYDGQKDHGRGIAPEERFRVNENQNANDEFEAYCNEQLDAPYLPVDLVNFYDQFIEKTKMALEDNFFSNFVNQFRTKNYIISKAVVEEVFTMLLEGGNKDDIHNKTGYPKTDILAIWERGLGDEERIISDTQRVSIVLKEFEYSVEDTVALTGLDPAFVMEVNNSLVPKYPVAPEEQAEDVQITIADEPLRKETPLERKKRLQAELADVESEIATDDLEELRAGAKTGLDDMIKCLTSLETCTLDSIKQAKLQLDNIENTFKSSMQSYHQKITNLSDKLGVK